MGKLLGLVLAVVGGFIAIHSLSTEEVQPASFKTAAESSEPNIMQSVPAPMPATAERRRMEQRDKHANAKTESAKTETAPAPVVQQAVTATETPETRVRSMQPAPLKTAEVVIRSTADTQTEKRTSANVDLARAIQGQLARVGCYSGPINGMWSEASQSAMKDFNARVNASLPVEQPDEVLLALVENYKDNACGCHSTEVRVNGRCVHSRSHQQAQRNKERIEQRDVRKPAAPKVVSAEPEQKPVPSEPWKTTTKSERTAKTTDSTRNDKAVAVPPPTVVATARQQLELAKERERHEVDTTNRMGLGLKQAQTRATTPATTTQPNLPVASLTQSPQATDPAPVKQPRVAAIVPPPVPEVTTELETADTKKPVRTATLAPPNTTKYVRRLSSPPPPVVYRTTAYKSYLRTGGIWRRQELNGR